MTTLNTMGKEELRAACRVAGISYGKLNNDGMRAALAAAAPIPVAIQVPDGFLPMVEAVLTGAPFSAAPEHEKTVTVHVHHRSTDTDGIVGNPFGGLMGAVAIPKFNGKSLKSMDGKILDEKSGALVAQPTAPRVRVAKTLAPFVPRATKKGYKIQKDREVRNGIKRPSEGTTCGNVWAALDAKHGVFAADLAAIADANGWNRTNVNCEFYAWKKFNKTTA